MNKLWFKLIQFKDSSYEEKSSSRPGSEGKKKKIEKSKSLKNKKQNIGSLRVLKKVEILPFNFF